MYTRHVKEVNVEPFTDAKIDKNPIVRWVHVLFQNIMLLYSYTMKCSALVVSWML